MGGPSVISAWHRRREDLAYALTLALLVGLWLGIGRSHWGNFSFEDDEGTFLVTAQAVYAGHPLYREVWFNYLPGFMGLLVAAFRLGGVTVEAARAMIVVCAALLLVGVGELARQLAGRRAGVLAPLLLLMTPGFVGLGHAVMAEVPASALTVWAMLAALLYLRSGRGPWLLASGLLIGGGILIKYPTAVALVPIVSAVFLHLTTADRGLPLSRLVGRLALLALAVVAPIMIGVLPFHLPTLWAQVVGTYLGSLSAYDVGLEKNIAKLAEYFGRNNWGMALLSCAGFLCWPRRRHAERGWAALWLGSYLISMLGHAPLSSHHLFLALVPMALVAGVGLAGLPHLFQGVPPGRSWLLFATFVLGLAVYIHSLPETLDEMADRLEWMEDDQPEEWEAVRLVDQYTAPGDYVISDFPMITFRAQRRTPPWLTNLSGMRFRTGGLTEQDLMRHTVDYRVRAVVTWENKLYKKAPQYVAWVGRWCRPVYDEIQEDPADLDDDKVRKVFICPAPRLAPGATMEGR